MGDYQPVPVAAAEEIASQYSRSVVVIFAFDQDHQRVGLTTFGVTATDKLNALMVRNKIAEAIGVSLILGDVHEDFRGDFDAALLKEARDILAIVRSQGTTPLVLQRIERWLVASGGQGLRRG